MQTQDWKQQAARQMKEICALLNWDEEDYCQHQYNCGRAYIYWYLPCDEDARNILERSKLYWAWWRNQWSLHDEAFLLHRRSYLEASIRRIEELYRELHDARALVIDVKPTRVVLNELKKEVVYG